MSQDVLDDWIDEQQGGQHRHADDARDQMHADRMHGDRPMRTLRLFSTNDYLGLSTHAKVSLPVWVCTTQRAHVSLKILNLPNALLLFGVELNAISDRQMGREDRLFMQI